MLFKTNEIVGLILERLEEVVVVKERFFVEADREMITLVEGELLKLACDIYNKDPYNGPLPEELTANAFGFSRVKTDTGVILINNNLRKECLLDHLSMRALNSIIKAYPNVVSHDKVSVLSTLSRDSIWRVKGVGKSTMEEIDKLCRKAGIEMSQG